MTIDELKAQNPALYHAIFALGETAGIEKERVRVNAHLMLGEAAGSLELAAKHIKAEIASNDEAVQAEYMAARITANQLEARNKDNLGGVRTGSDDGGNIDDAKLEAAFDSGFAGKNTEGKSWE